MTVVQAVTWMLALIAVGISIASYRLNLRDKSLAWEGQERAQAEEVSGWLAREMCDEHQEMEWKAYVRNGSKSPVYDVLYVIHDRQDLDAAMPEIIPLVPPDTTWDFFPTWFGEEELPGNPKVYMTFRDKRGQAWQRDTHGRLEPTHRPVDDAPPADPVSGRISYSYRTTRKRRLRARWAEAILKRYVDGEGERPAEEHMDDSGWEGRRRHPPTHPGEQQPR